jgi:ethanolamine-phosphate cytidylyltransferase
VFGLNSDAEILINKGPPVMNSQERIKLIRGCKWVGESFQDTPYTVTEQLLDHLKCDYYMHGDDPCYNSEGLDVCEEMAKIGKFKVFKRTSGVSTTSITTKLLRLFET